jgi:hypothetical protein
MHSKYTTITKLILRASKKVNDGHAVAAEYERIVREDGINWRHAFAFRRSQRILLATSAIGTKPTNRTGLAMSVDRARPKVAGARTKWRK